MAVRRQFDNDKERTVMSSMRAFASAAVLALGLLAGATAVAQTGEREIRSGVIEQITEVQMPTNHHRGLGAVIGGLGGLGIGSLIGAGTGATSRWYWERSEAR
jgi:outer membrane lipoprotein SlyB